MRRVLVRCPNWLGDTVMSVPTLRALRAALPAAEIWAIGPWVESILEAEPAVDRLIGAPRGWPARWRLAQELARSGMDVALLLPNSFDAALFARLARVPRRIGYAGDSRSWLLTDPVRHRPGWRHQVGEYLALLAPLGVAPSSAAPELVIAAGRRDEAQRLLATVGVSPGDRAVGIQLGAAFGPSKLWSADRLAGLATALGSDGVPVVFLGDPGARRALGAVEAAMGRPVAHLVGRDHPALLPALLAALAVLVSPDSGPAHVGAAVGVPVVTLFGPTDPRLTAPRGPRSRPLWRPPPCAPCFRQACPIDLRCLTAITEEEVLTAVRQELGTSARPVVDDRQRPDREQGREGWT